MAAATYVVGGRELMRQLARRGRQMQSTATAALQPPTQAEIQRATEDTARAPAGPETGVAPISIGVMALWIASILIFVSALVFLTGRDPRKPRRD